MRSLGLEFATFVNERAKRGEGCDIAPWHSVRAVPQIMIAAPVKIATPAIQSDPELAADYKPDYDSLRDLLLELAQERTVNGLLEKIVARLAARPYVVLTRIWLLEKGDCCKSCSMADQCRERTYCLHLLASAGSLRNSAPDDDASGEKEFRRVPLDFGEVGRIARSGEQAVLSPEQGNLSGIGQAQWDRERKVRGFNGQPIIFHGKLLGVIGLYYRIETPAQSPRWIRLIADHIASAIVNARAFEEIEQLKARFEQENSYLHEEVREAKSFGEIIGGSADIRQLLRQLTLVAPTNASVLILGESGTGKELVAREIHRQSKRSRLPFIRVNCASVPRELYESEFFGHVKGAFTGAVKDRAGRFAAADGGTLFLDEVGEIPLELQSKFLRVLQEKQYERVGEDRTRTVDVRIIAATNRDLKKDVESGRFRQDLFYRLNVFPLEVPPLRKHPEDIPVLAAHFLMQASQKLKVPPAHLTRAHVEQLQNYAWPGNVRELQNCIERALILAQAQALRFDLPFSQSTAAESDQGVLKDNELRRRERANLMAALEKARWKIHGPGGAAEMLGLKPTTLISRAKKLGLSKPE